MRIASYNVENLFARPKAFDRNEPGSGQPILRAFREVNELFGRANYTEANKARMSQLLVALDIYAVNDQGAVRRHRTQSPRWAWMRKNRGSFDRQPNDSSQDVEIIANGRGDWLGWVALATETADETTTRMTARVITDVAADVIGVIEAEDRPSLVRLNQELLGGFYDHVMLVDGNDDRGIDVGLMTRGGFAIESIRSNVDATDAVGEIFSRDCPQYTVSTPLGNTVHVLVNHFKSQSGGGGAKRLRQARAVRRIADGLVAQNQHVVVIGDLNEGIAGAGQLPANLRPLFQNSSPLTDCYMLVNDGMNLGERPGTFDSCGFRNRLDYILISQSLVPLFQGGEIFRRGLWGTRQSRPTAWATYPEMQSNRDQASDHAAVFIDLNV